MNMSEYLMNDVEIIKSNDKVLAYIVRSSLVPHESCFLTTTDLNMQMGFIVYDKGKNIQPHMHIPVLREIQGTAECIFVKQGHCIIDIYDSSRAITASKELYTGDVILLLEGGHGFRMLENTVLFEIKQGPYVGLKDKERF